MLSSFWSDWITNIYYCVANLELKRRVIFSSNLIYHCYKNKVWGIAFSPPNAVKWWCLSWFMYIMSLKLFCLILKQFSILNCFLMFSFWIVAVRLPYESGRFDFCEKEQYCKCKNRSIWPMCVEYTSNILGISMFFHELLKIGILFLAWRNRGSHFIHEWSRSFIPGIIFYSLQTVISIFCWITSSQTKY